MPEQQLEFCGISFRSHSHMYWFQGSMVFALMALGTLLVCARSRPPADTMRLVRITFAVVLCFHLFAFVSASLNAYHKVYVLGTSPNGPLFSVDCIWWNALVSAYYLALILAARRLAPPAEPTLGSLEPPP